MIYFNDASLHGQFPAFEPFNESMRTLWEIRKALVEKGLQLRVCRSVRTRHVTPEQTFNDFLGAIPKQLKTRLLLWLDREGPFWDDERHHSDGEYFECAGELVTETGAAEAACLQAEGTPAWLFTLNPSKFLNDPLAVHWLGSSDGDIPVEIPNGWELGHMDRCVAEFDCPFENWGELREWAERECGNLFLPPTSWIELPLEFIPYVAQQSRILLDVLNLIVGFVKDENDSEFQELRRVWMEGGKARFSPSSATELNDFAAKLTFRQPESGKDVVCSWHGKIKSPQFRIHFEWPLPEGADRLFVAYVGPKLTKR